MWKITNSRGDITLLRAKIIGWFVDDISSDRPGYLWVCVPGAGNHVNEIPFEVFTTELSVFL